ncbi:hypothetical protein ACJX0J_014283 [Zea mays]
MQITTALLLFLYRFRYMHGHDSITLILIAEKMQAPIGHNITTNIFMNINFATQTEIETGTTNAHIHTIYYVLLENLRSSVVSATTVQREQDVRVFFLEHVRALQIIASMHYAMEPGASELAPAGLTK